MSVALSTGTGDLLRDIQRAGLPARGQSTSTDSGEDSPQRGNDTTTMNAVLAAVSVLPSSGVSAELSIASMGRTAVLVEVHPTRQASVVGVSQRDGAG